MLLLRCSLPACLCLALMMSLMMSVTVCNLDTSPPFVMVPHDRLAAKYRTRTPLDPASILLVSFDVLSHLDWLKDHR